jgi:CheY-like chemotaxis protein
VPGPILLVEDDDALRAEVRELLEGDGQTVIEASDGWEALVRLRENVYSLVVLDIGLPIMTGWELLARMRGEEALREVPVIILSAKPVAEAVDSPPVFRKPIDRATFLAAVHRHMR